MKTIIILGASGIIGQYMRLNTPFDVKSIWTRSKSDRLHIGLELNDPNNDTVFKFIMAEKPYAVVNLAGQSDVDTVGRDAGKYNYINATLPGLLAEFCQRYNIHYVHVSSQAVFDGTNPPYHERSATNAINAYGRQKIEAEQRVMRVGSGWTIVRPSFVLGIRPMPHVGRANPAEQMVSQEKQVSDRWFTANMAENVAATLWNVATDVPQTRVIHVDGFSRVSRYDLATAMNAKPEAVSHDDFPGLSPRPLDTTFGTSYTGDTYDMARTMRDLAYLNLDTGGLGPMSRAREISLFTLLSEQECYNKLATGFMRLHEDVSNDFRNVNPQNDSELLEWYRNTMAYIWELTAYHLDAGFNYVGMCSGVANALVTKLTDGKRVLVLGDGIGDMTLTLLRSGLDAVYHDLRDSDTAKFAQMRLWMHTGHECETLLSNDWNPPKVLPGNYDAICAADFMEHLPNVEEWVKWIHTILRPGGLLFAQNAFNCGSGPDGGMPMHLDRNNRFEKDWDPLLERLGFKQLSSNWYEKIVVEPYASVKAV